MNINPMMLLQLKGEADKFKARHPKLELFFMDAVARMDAGSVLEVSLTASDGQKIRTNFRVTDEDKALFEQLKGDMK